MKNGAENIKAVDLEKAILLLNKYAMEDSIKPLITILEALRQDLKNELLLAQLTDTWRNLGIYQGTVLTYVPKFYTWIPDDIFGDDLP